MQFFDISWSLWSSIIWPKICKIGIYKTQKSHFPYRNLKILRPIFTISRRCQVPRLISPERRKIRPSNFQDLLVPCSRFRKCTGMIYQEGCVGGVAPQKSKKRKSPFLRGLWGESLQGYGPRVGQVL